MEEIHTLKASTKSGTSLQVMLKLLEENVNLSLRVYDYREHVVERTRIKQEQFLEQFNSSLAESPTTVQSPSNSPPRSLSRRNDRTSSSPSSSALLSTLTNRLWQRTPPQQTQQKDEYEDDDGAW